MMIRLDKIYRWPLLFAIALHMALLVFLIAKLPSDKNIGLNGLGQAPKIIEARAVVQDPIQAQHALAKKERLAQQRKLEMQRQLAKEKALEQQRALAQQRKVEHQAALAKAALAHKKALALKKAQATKAALAVKKALAQKQAKRLKQQKLLLAQQQALQKQLQQQQLKDEQQTLAKSRQQALAGVVDKYMSQIKAAIQQNWHQPFQNANLVSVYDVQLAPGGAVLNVKLVQSSGNALLDRSGRLAILKSSPLPVPTDPTLFDSFREFTIKMSPKTQL